MEAIFVHNVAVSDETERKHIYLAKAWKPNGMDLIRAGILPQHCMQKASFNDKVIKR